MHDQCTQPDAIAPLLPSQGDDRRTDVRYALVAPGLVADRTGVHDCIVVDISLGGCMLEGQFHMRNGMEVAVGVDSLMGLLGEIVHAGPGFVGVKFHMVPDRRNDIRTWIAARLKIARVGSDSGTSCLVPEIDRSDLF